jgi:PAS domain S-box-containing protein
VRAGGAQLAGAAPSAWEFESALRVSASPSPVELPDGIERPADVAWIVGDEHNRIVGASPAVLDLLGWPDGELIGQRLLVVIPPHLRERHVAGFTRSVVSGDDRLLDVPLELPALHRDGREIPIVLTLSRHTSRAPTSTWPPSSRADLASSVQLRDTAVALAPVRAQ